MGQLMYTTKQCCVHFRKSEEMSPNEAVFLEVSTNLTKQHKSVQNFPPSGLNQRINSALPTVVQNCILLEMKAGSWKNYSVKNSLETSLPSGDFTAFSISGEDEAGFWLASATSQVLEDCKEILILVTSRR